MNKKTLIVVIFVILFFYIILRLFNPEETLYKDTSFNIPSIQTNEVAKPIPVEQSWTLFTYAGKTPNKENQKNRVEGYKSQTECIEKGISISATSDSFECAYGCKYRPEYREEICGKVCGANGCRD
ncbi:hypothetical protein A3J13_02225 [Candidatus Daviesbacteria bacterium RIFCSPLOWO2_02_FULL_36_8]|uniref:Uncharacterized protein n=1 Tax=Candidatus Daviesbacteria bacterium RIFCSPLOWO2_02_FULL_36_8 TaxID=1797793 RepID=A0A1F5MH28_9BACT|nr:MAG: hypothetical protein A3J13_02225 [Candidatus Daviesbacteria bacterium RIFCSPLOWO2_02_FULL_36_8]